MTNEGATLPLSQKLSKPLLSALFWLFLSIQAIPSFRNCVPAAGGICFFAPLAWPEILKIVHWPCWIKGLLGK